MAKYLALAAALCLAASAAADGKQSEEKAEPARKVAEKWEYAELHYSFKAKARWLTGDGETEGETWADLAAKLKAPAAAKDAKPAAHKMKLLNHLGAQGWEMVSSSGNTWTFKRKLAK